MTSAVPGRVFLYAIEFISRNGKARVSGRGLSCSDAAGRRISLSTLGLCNNRHPDEPHVTGLRIKDRRRLVGERTWTAAPTGLDDAWMRTTLHGRFAMNANVDHFLQECPVCSRPLQVSSDLTGRRVTCLHCRGRFLASSSVANSLSPISGVSFLLRRAEDLIEIASRRAELCATGITDLSVRRSVASGSRLQSGISPIGRSARTLWRDLREVGRGRP